MTSVTLVIRIFLDPEDSRALGGEGRYQRIGAHQIFDSIM